MQILPHVHTFIHSFIHPSIHFSIPSFLPSLLPSFPLRSLPSQSSLQIRFKLFYIFRAANKAGTLLMDSFWLDGQHISCFAVNGLPTGLTDNKGHGRRLVEQLEVTTGMLQGIGGVAKNTTIHESPVDVAYHTTDVPMCVRVTRLVRARLESPQVVLEFVGPTLRVGLIARVDIATFWDGQVWVCQDKLVDLRIERKAHDLAFSECKDQNGRTGVHTIPGGLHVPTLL